MNTKEAIKYMKEGGKICLKDWPPFYYLYMKDSQIYDSNNISINILEDLNWEIYKEPDMLFCAARCESERINRL